VALLSVHVASFSVYIALLSVNKALSSFECLPEHEGCRGQYWRPAPRRSRPKEFYARSLRLP